jgi:hypothetical protein
MISDEVEKYSTIYNIYKCKSLLWTLWPQLHPNLKDNLKYVSVKHDNDVLNKI